MAQPPHSRRVSPRLLVFVVALALVAAACGGGDEDSGEESTETTAPVEEENLEPVMGGKVVYGIDAESDGYNTVTKRFAQSGHTVASAVYDPLATIDENGEVVPFLAESFEPNEDFTEWTINLREGVEFHTGEVLTADHIVTILDAHRESLVSAAGLSDVTSVEAIDDQTVLVKVAQPWRNFPGMLTTQVGYVFDPAMLTDPESGGHPVGTGPFVFDEWERFDRFSVVRNPNYWRTDEFGNQMPYLDGIDFQIIPDGAARNEALISGDIDLLFTLTPGAVLDLRDTPDIVMDEYNLGDEDLVSLVVDDVPRDPDGTAGPLEPRVSPFNNIHARRALAYATDQARFIEESTLGMNAPATGPYSPGQLGYREDNGYPEYDPEKAAEELALYTEDTGEETLSFVYSASDDVDNVQLAQDLVEMWGEVGIEATINAIPQSDIIVNAVIGNYEATDWRNWAQPDPDIDYLWFHSSNVKPLEEGISLNIAHHKSDEIDAALELGRSSGDETERDEAYASVAAVMGEEVPYIWLGRVGWAMASNPNTHGWQVGIDNGTVATIGAKTWVGELWVE